MSSHILKHSTHLLIMCTLRGFSKTRISILNHRVKIFASLQGKTHDKAHPSTVIYQAKSSTLTLKALLAALPKRTIDWAGVCDFENLIFANSISES